MKNKGLLIVVSALSLYPHVAWSHGYAGNRYFPPTVEVGDPFAANEIHAVFGKRPGGADPSSTRSNAYSAGGGIGPVDGFGMSLDATCREPNQNISPTSNRFDNLALTIKKELAINAEHEYAITAGFASRLGGTGATGTTSPFTFCSALFYAKGFGDLPESIRLLRPLAFTGVISRETPTERSRPAMLNWGFTPQYRLSYLTAYVGGIGLPAPFTRLIPGVGFPLRTCLSYGCSEQTTGTLNPGAVWMGPVNLSVQAVVPINARSGVRTGVLLQLHKFLSQ